MVKIRKQFLGLALVGILSIGSVGALVPQIGLAQAEEVEVAEYTQLRSKDGYTYYFKSREAVTAYNKAKEIITSIQKNYAGIKNQPTWEKYIKEARSLINKIPSKYGRDIEEVTNTVDDLDHFVKYVAKMNHVEKSYATNYQGIKNAAQWEIYLEDALKERFSITWVDEALKAIYPKLDEVNSRYDVIEAKVDAIVKAYNVACDKVWDKYDLAYDNDDLALAKEALAEAKNLGTHPDTVEVVEALEELIKYLS